MCLHLFSRGMEDIVGGDGGPPLIPQHRPEPCGLLQLPGEGPVQLRPGPLRAVHVPWEAHDQLLHPPLPDQAGQLLHHHFRLPALDHRGIPGQQAGGVGHRDPRAGVSIVDRHHSHPSTSFPFSLDYTVSRPKPQALRGPPRSGPRGPGPAPLGSRPRSRILCLTFRGKRDKLLAPMKRAFFVRIFTV